MRNQGSARGTLEIVKAHNVGMLTVRYVQFAFALALFVGLAAPVHATVYELLAPDQQVVGEDQTITTVYEDTLYDLARKYSLGSEEVIRVNPGVDPWLPGAGKQVIIPGRHILPPGRTKGSSSICPSTGCTIFPNPSAASIRPSSAIRSVSARWTGTPRSASRT